MSINVRESDILEVGEYKRIVDQVRDNPYNLEDYILAGTLKINLNTLKTVRFVIKLHPDWNDEVVAEKVLDLEDEGFDVDKATEENLTTV